MKKPNSLTEYLKLSSKQKMQLMIDRAAKAGIFDGGEQIEPTPLNGRVQDALQLMDSHEKNLHSSECTPNSIL